MVGIKRKTTSTSSSSSDSNWNHHSASTSSPSKVKTSPKKISKIEEAEPSHEEDEVHLKRGETTDYLRLWEFVQFVKNALEENPELKKRKGNANLEVILNEESRKEWPDFDAMVTSLKAYYTKSVLVSKTNIGFVTTRLEEFMQEDAFVTYHPDYPKPIATARNILCRKLGLGIGIDVETVKAKDPNDVLSTESAKEAEADRIRYYNELNAFLAKHRAQLLPGHISYVEKKLEKITKEKQKQEKANHDGTPKKSKSTKAKLTAFDYYKQSKKHKYLELPHDEREAKLKRHFEKLDEDTRHIFEDLASNL